MSKYQEMCAAYQNARALHIRHRDETVDFVASLFSGAIAYLEIPQDKLFLFKPSEPTSEARIGPREAVEGQPDGSYTVGFAFILNERNGGFPAQSLHIVANIRSRESRFLVRISSGPEIIVPKPLTALPVNAVLDQIHSAVLRSYVREVAPFIDDEA